MELETVKTYIKNNLANNFIRPSKFFIDNPILFIEKPNRSLQLSIDYRDLNNLTMKNPYPFSLIGKSLD